MTAEQPAHLVLSAGGVRCLAYIGALESLRLPVPYALRDELRLHQQIFDR